MTHTIEELERLRQIWLTSEDEDDAFAFAEACGNALPELVAKVKRYESALKKIAADDGLYTHRHEYEAIARAALQTKGTPT